ncbi:uncharacterized protein LOC105160077 [Sesamum indicum]|uniref:Uncharacterized protein LOC105160077 n=1 Tax=Sesamum indicum TaxID=4182 RepID=A0A6I9T130_SESIN|nr:uncharacterized protein LOC105160077 [Sesamum indicum]
MPDCFEFKEDDISLTPVWATLPSLPLECWHPNALGKISSRIGSPIAMDSLTMKMERVSYARILVEINASKKLIDQVEFVMPNDITRKQPVVYEFTPKFCTDYHKLGHLQETCQGAHLQVVAAAPAKQAEAKKPQTTEWTIVQRRNKGKAIDTAAKPAVEGHQPISPTASKVDKGRMSTKVPHSLKLQDREVPLPTDSDSSSTDSPMITQHAMLGIKTNETAMTFSKPTKQAGEESPPRSFLGWCQANNFDTIAGGHILVVWNPTIIDLQPEDISPQVIHCRATNKSSQLSFYISFTYGLYSVVNRRSMWEKLTELGQTISMPWLIMDDFNCVKSPEEKQLGVAPTWYELKDFVDCCAALGLHDVPTTGCYYTWYSNNESNPVWYKLDRVLYNNEWLEAGLHCGAHLPIGMPITPLPGIVTIFDCTPTKPKPFRFFNMWADHPDFLTTVEQRWNFNVEGTPQFRD